MLLVLAILLIPYIDMYAFLYACALYIQMCTFTCVILLSILYSNTVFVEEIFAELIDLPKRVISIHIRLNLINHR